MVSIGDDSCRERSRLSLIPGVIISVPLLMTLLSTQYFMTDGESECPECGEPFSLRSRHLGIEEKHEAGQETMDDGSVVITYQFDGKRVLDCQNPDCEATVIRNES